MRGGRCALCRSTAHAGWPLCSGCRPLSPSKVRGRVGDMYTEEDKGILPHPACVKHCSYSLWPPRFHAFASTTIQHDAVWVAGVNAAWGACSAKVSEWVSGWRERCTLYCTWARMGKWLLMLLLCSKNQAW